MYFLERVRAGGMVLSTRIDYVPALACQQSREGCQQEVNRGGDPQDDVTMMVWQSLVYGGRLRHRFRGNQLSEPGDDDNDMFREGGRCRHRTTRIAGGRP